MSRTHLTRVLLADARIAGAQHILRDHFLRVVGVFGAHLIAQHRHLDLLQHARRLAVLLERAPAGGHRRHVRVQIVTALRQADRPDHIVDGHAIVEAQQRNVIVEVREAELLRNGAQHEARLRAHRVVAAIVLAEGDLDHEPHETGKERCGEEERTQAERRTHAG